MKIGRISRIRGMNDILPDKVCLWTKIENIIRKVCLQYGYREIRFPIVEKTDLFDRSVGEITDIINKEMYTFKDINGDFLSLRPEGTAGCTRSCIENGLLYKQQQKLFYFGPMFRHERPQRGRYRQFNQFGVETYGISDVGIDVELILFANKIWSFLGLSNRIKLKINSLGTSDTRREYVRLLTSYLNEYMHIFSQEDLIRAKYNPLRFLDNKKQYLQKVIAGAPKITDFLSRSSSEKFHRLLNILDSCNLDYIVDHHLVRGLDYYTDTVFEWEVDCSDEGNVTICAGGRYDGLVEKLGGESTCASGFALGMERLVLLLENDPDIASNNSIDLFCVCTDDEKVIARTLEVAENIRKALPALSVFVDFSRRSVKSQMKRANNCNARLVMITGQEELENDIFTIKDMFMDGGQIVFDCMENLIAYLTSF